MEIREVPFERAIEILGRSIYRQSEGPGQGHHLVRPLPTDFSSEIGSTFSDKLNYEAHCQRLHVDVV